MNTDLVPAQLPELPAALRTAFTTLSRLPDIDSADLTAVDQADTLAARILAHTATGTSPASSSVLVLNDSYGALSVAAAYYGATVLSFQDRCSQAEAARRNVAARQDSREVTALSYDDLLAPTAELAAWLKRVEVVLLKLPRANEELGWLAWAAAKLSPGATMIAVGRQKYMTPAQNEVLARYYDHVQASRGFGKARALIGKNARTDSESFPEPWRTMVHHVPVLPAGVLRLSAGSAVFGGARLDPGSRLLINSLAKDFRPAVGDTVVDLGCGNGSLAIAAALLRPGQPISAVDQSASAVEATVRSAELNGVRASVTAAQMDALSGFPANSAAHVLLNPPFHSGHAVDAGIAHKLFTDVGRVLRPGGHLWCVWNSPLRYRPVLERVVGPTEQLERNQKFTVTRSTRN